MKLSPSLIAAVSVNFAVAAVHTGPHFGVHQTRSVDSWEEVGMSLAAASVYYAAEVQQNSSKAKKHHDGNGGKHDSGVGGHHPDYNMSVVKSTETKSHKTKVSTKTSKAFSHPIETKSSKLMSVNVHSIPVHVSSKASKDHSIPMHVSSEATKDESTETTITVAPIEDLHEVLSANNTAEGADTSVLKAVGQDNVVNVILTGGKGSSHQSKLGDESSVNMKGQEQASMLSDTKNSASITVTTSAIVCLMALAFYM
jgi:hypothetical protein